LAASRRIATERQIAWFETRAIALLSMRVRD
jgi:hypothetical protein